MGYIIEANHEVLLIPPLFFLNSVVAGFSMDYQEWHHTSPAIKIVVMQLTRFSL
jgi:hypothetical protein